MMPKDQMNLFRPTNLKRGQVSESWPKKGQSGSPGLPLQAKERAQVICNLTIA